MKRIGIILLLALALASACHAAPVTDLSQIAEQIDDDRSDEAESALMALREKDPRNPEIFTLLARIEYLRALGNASRLDGYPPMNWDSSHMDAAERLVREAIGIDAKHANAWVIYGQIAYARSNLDESLRRLEKAEALDPSSVKLRLRKGATLRALAEYYADKTFLERSAEEYKQAIHGKIDDGNERLAANEIGDVFNAMGEYDKALDYLTRALDSASGSERSFLLDRRSRTYILAGNADSAIADARASLEAFDHGIGRERLAAALLVKAGMLMRDEHSAEASSEVALALETGADLIRMAGILAYYPGTFPAVYAYLDPGLKQLDGERVAAAVLCQASRFISPSDLKRLDKLGVDLNYADPQLGALLHCAIQANNVDAVTTLLQLNVNTSMLDPDGRTLLETTLIGTSADRRQIRRLVLAKLGKPPGWKDPEVDMPISGHWYKAERTIGDPRDKVLQAGQIVLSGGSCRIPGKSTLCMSFYKRPKEYLGEVTLPLARMTDLKALREIPAPTDAAHAECTVGNCQGAPMFTEHHAYGEGATRKAALANALESAEESCKTFKQIPVDGSLKVVSEEEVSKERYTANVFIHCE